MNSEAHFMSERCEISHAAWRLATGCWRGRFEMALRLGTPTTSQDPQMA